MTISQKSEIIVEAVWVKPFFKKGFTEYHVVRKTTSNSRASAYHHANETYHSTMLYKSLDINEAVEFKDKLVQGGVK